jgi:preprotein translocase subunit SecA
MEASILSKQIENAQKKVEEQNFVARKNVLKYDDVMNLQRQVIYEQRRRVLEGADMSAELRDWVTEVVDRIVRLHLEEEDPNEWDLDRLVNALQQVYRTTITAEELSEEVELDDQALVEEFVEDALDDYGAKEAMLGPELMRELERFVVLQVVDHRWREHLENMEYLREGVHLRAMAQKDPLVEYRGEGHQMFEALSQAIREEVVVLVFHAELVPEDAQELHELQAEQAAESRQLSYEHESLAGAEAIAQAMGQGGGAGTLVYGDEPAPVVVQRVLDEHDKIGRNEPCWCGSGKKFKKCHGA